GSGGAESGAGRQRIGLGEQALVPADGTFRFVEQRRVEDLLAIAGEPDVGQSSDRLVKIVDARLDVEVEAEVLPEFVRFNEGGWLRVLAVLAFEEIMVDAKVTLPIDH